MASIGKEIQALRFQYQQIDLAIKAITDWHEHTIQRLRSEQHMDG